MKKNLLVLAFLLGAVFCAAEEYIKNYDVELVLNKDGSARVTENISANAEHDKINRGLYRDLPYSFDAGFGLSGTMAYKVVSLTRNGKTEPYFTEPRRGKLRVNFGNDDLIPTGINAYSLVYDATNAAGFFKDYDEIYWNVTGNEWAFPIRAASYVLRLPPGAEVIKDKISVYSGPSGSTNTPRFTMTENGSELRFVFKDSLDEEEGFTVAVPFKKGLLVEPTAREKAQMFFMANFKFALLPLWVLIVFLYFFAVWTAVGRDKRIKPVYAVYDPPPGMTPAMAQFLYTTGEGSGPSYLSLFIISFAVKKCLKIEHEKTFLASSYVLTPVKENISALDAKELEVFQSLFSSRENIKLSGDYNSEIGELASKIGKAVDDEGKSYVLKNTKYLAIGFVLSMLFFVITGYITYQNIIFPAFLTLFYSIFVGMNMAVVAGLISSVMTKTGRSILTSAGLLAGSLALTAFMLVHSAAFFTNFSSFIFTALYCVCYVALMIIFGVFNVLMPSFTDEGRRLLSELTAFKEYLDVGEFGRIAASSPEAQAEVFCKYYPYAVAFNMESKWNKHFENILGDAAAQRVVDERGLGAMRGGGAFMAGALAGAVASTATRPSSRGGGGGGHGSGGGGSSGGGHGGGGGGGR